ncbi:MAG: creatininase family protein [Actinobacteria bacterium]|nr:creatininase family protein [Actinomycetota bacterium]
MAFSRQFTDLSGPDIGDVLSEDSIVVVPLGAVEQHGPHLPLGTDLFVADAVARATIEAHGEAHDAWMLPPLGFTKSNEHAWSPGTIWLSAQTLLSVLDDIGRCNATTPARRVLFLNGHGGNSALLQVANRELRVKHGLRTFLAHPHMPADQGGSSATGELGMGIHGGTDETSVMLHLRPDLVDMTKAVRRVPEKIAENKHVRFGGSVPFGWMSNDFFPEGHIGDPTGASAELGASMFATAVATLGEVLGEVSRFDFGR